MHGQTKLQPALIQDENAASDIPANATSDINFKSLISKGITGGLKSVTVSATEWIVGYGLNAVFGIQTPKVKKANEVSQLTADLDNINSEIVWIAKSIAAIEQELDSLASQLKTDLNIELAAIKQTTLDNDLKNIKNQWTAFSNLVLTQYNTFNTANPPATGGADTTASGGSNSLILAQEIMGTNGSSGAVTAIFNFLYNAALPNSQGLINDWTNSVISALYGKRNSVDAATYNSYVLCGYQNIEQNFLSNLQLLYTGYALVLNAQIRINDNLSHSQTYLSSTITPQLKALCNNFLQCVHRLILSNYGMVGTSGFLPFLTQATVQTILTRAYLVTGLIMADNDEPPGLVAVSYTRPSVLASTPGGPPLTPASGYAPRQGKQFNPAATYPGTWYKVFDFTDATCTTAYDFADSDIVVLEYAWPLGSSAAAGTPIAPSGMFANAVPQYYDKSTLRPSNSNNGNAVLYGLAADFSALMENPFCDQSSAGWTMTSKLPTSNVGTLVLTNASTIDGLPKSVSIDATENSNFGGDTAVWEYATLRTFTCPEKTAQLQLELAGSWAIWCSGGVGWDVPHVGSGGKLTLNSTIFWEGNISLSHTYVGTGSAPGSQAPTTLNSFSPQSLTGGTNTLTLGASINPQHIGSVHGAMRSNPLYMYAVVTVSKALVCWVQPPPPISS